MREDVPNCKGNDCQDPEGYLPTCVRCNIINVKCATCGKEHSLLPGDPDRGDLFVRDLPVSSWMCPSCTAMEMGISERKIDRSSQATLEGFK